MPRVRLSASETRWRNALKDCNHANLIDRSHLRTPCDLLSVFSCRSGTHPGSPRGVGPAIVAVRGGAPGDAHAARARAPASDSSSISRRAPGGPKSPLPTARSQLPAVSRALVTVEPRAASREPCAGNRGTASRQPPAAIYALVTGSCKLATTPPLTRLRQPHPRPCLPHRRLRLRRWRR